MVELYGKPAATVTAGANDMLEAKVAAAIQETLAAGEHVEGGVERVKAAFEAAGVAPNNSFTFEAIVRTSVAQAYGAGAWNALQEPGIAEIHESNLYATAGDDRVREEHQAWDGFCGPADHDFFRTHWPPCGWACVPGDSLVRGEIKNALKIRYSGPLIVIESRAGHRLAITPNHPVLTDHGWIAADKISEGQTLFSYNGPTDPMVGNGSNQNTPARIEDVFQSLVFNRATPFRIAAAKLSALDLHGDAQFSDGKIHIVGANRILPFKVSTEPFHKFKFTVGANASNGLIAIESLSGLHSIFQATFATRVSFMSSINLLRSLFWRHLMPFNVLTLGLGARRNSYPSKPLNNSPMLHSKFITKLLRAGSGMIARDHVLRVRRTEFSGHVYDLQTIPSYYISQNIVISNCRCQIIPLFDVAEDNIPDDYEAADPGFGQVGAFALDGLTVNA